MNESKFTSGPWMVDPKASTRVMDTAGTTIASAGMASRILEDAQSNARFIAAAPEMYDMLMEIKKTIEESEQWWMESPDRGGFDLDKIISVLQKAGLE